MSCNSCIRALPLLLDWEPLGRSETRHSVLYRCRSCGAWYEQLAEEWRGPHEISKPEAVTQFPEVRGSGIRCRNLEDLPRHVRRRIEEVAPDRDLSEWVRSSLPALGGRSILEVMDDEEGEQRVLELLRDIRGMTE